jgi:cyclopropane fatty-acyl-phospholipid synthase-like methyltransferase
MKNNMNKKFAVAQDIYDNKYFEDGIVSGKSCYQNYRWLPELTIKMAYNIIKYLGLEENERILDYGCSMGYLVKALRLLEIKAYGCDISSYAISRADPEVNEYCDLITPEKLFPFKDSFNWIISKDVLEHLDEGLIDGFLSGARDNAEKMFHVIPLGDDGKYRIPMYHEDTSHVMACHEDWWKKKFEAHGWAVKNFDYKVRGVKENWTERYKRGNGFFVLEKA